MQPASYDQFGATPYIDPTYAQAGQVQRAADVDPNMIAGVPTMGAAKVDPAQLSGWYNQYADQLKTAMAPTFQDQTRDLNADMAARGIFDSTAGQLMTNDLSGRQAAALANPLGQMTQQFAGYAQQDALTNAGYQEQGIASSYDALINAIMQNSRQGLAASEANQQRDINQYGQQASLDQNANQFNAAASNDANGANAAAYGAQVSQDQSQYNAFLNELMQQGMGLTDTELGAYLSSYGLDPSATSLLSTGLANAGNAYNSVYGSGAGVAGAYSNAFGNAFKSLIPQPSSFNPEQFNNAIGYIPPAQITPPSMPDQMGGLSNPGGATLGG